MELRSKQNTAFLPTADLHIHLLCGVDDGARDEETMRAMVDAAYDDGTRVICATPHYHPGFFGENHEKSRRSFQLLRAYVKQRYPDLHLYLGNELRYGPSAPDWLERKVCNTMNRTRYVLVDFTEHESADTIVQANLQLLNAGYLPILAHAERYENLHRDFREILRLQGLGVTIQIDADSLFGAWSRNAKKRSRALLEQGIAQLAASDAHNLTSRPPQLAKYRAFVAKEYGESYAKRLFWDTPLAILRDQDMDF